MKNSTLILDVLLSIMIPLSMLVIPNLFIASIVVIITVNLFVMLNITNIIYKLSFPYTTDEVIILNCMKVVNWVIGKRFQILFFFRKLNRKKIKYINNLNKDKIIFCDGFYFFDNNKWRKSFPWGNCNNKEENVICNPISDALTIQMKHEDYIGYWDGDRFFHNTTGMIYSVETLPIASTYEARIKLSKVNHINQNFWLIGFQDPPLEKKIAELDIFEYHLTENKITLSQHWGNCYGNENHFPDKAHKQDSFSVKINLQDGKFHIFKLKVTKRNMFWYVDNILIKWHFLGIPKFDLNIVVGMGNVNDGKDVTSTGKLNLDELPTTMYCDWVKVSKNK